MKQLEEQYECALRIIMRQCKSCEEEQEFNGQLFPVYMQTDLKNIFLTLNSMGYITNPRIDISGISRFYVTKKAKLYFLQKEEYIKSNIPADFHRLSESARNILALILDSQNPVQCIKEMFDGVSDKEDSTLRNVFKELRENECVDAKWGSNEPYIINVLYKGENYFMDEYESAARNERNLMNKQNIISIETFNATGSNVVLGNAINSNLSIDNSIENIQKEITEKGGDDKEELNDLLMEIKDIISNMETTRQIPKNSSFLKRMEKHCNKNGWFYGAILSLLGSALIKIFGM